MTWIVLTVSRPEVQLQINSPCRYKELRTCKDKCVSVAAQIIFAALDRTDVEDAVFFFFS